MKQVWKFQLDTRDGVALDMPAGAKILSLQTQGEVPTLWALVEPEAEPEARWFRIYETGHPVDMEGEFIGTCQLHGGALIFHVFEVAPPGTGKLLN